MIAASPATAATPKHPSPLRALLLRAGGFMLAACGFVWLSLALAGNEGFAAWYFRTQDVVSLGIGGVALLGFASLALRGGGVMALTRWQVAVLAVAAALAAWAGSWLVMMRYPLSRDEQMAEFATHNFRHGALGWRVPGDLRHAAPAMLPEWSDSFTPSGYWASGYLPVNSLFRVAAGWLGDGWLAGPILLGIGLVALWHVARRLWPEDRSAATVTLVLALTSTQLLANAMTPYAMTGLFALNAAWLACFVRGGRAGHGAAIAIGIAATGMHQLHFHPMFVAGFVAWLWWSGRRPLALIYAAACVGYVALWGVAWPRLVAQVLALHGPGQPAAPLAALLLGKLARLAELEPVTSLARFAAWQNVLVPPLAMLGVAAVRARRAPPVLAPLAIGCGVGLATMIYQGHGLGYRYLHGFIPGVCLLAAAGWRELGHRDGRPVPGTLLAASAALALLVTGPFLLWRSHAFAAPYAAAYRAVRAAPADVVLVDPDAGAFARDVVRFEGGIARPLVLDLAYLPEGSIEKLCAARRVMVFGQPQAQALGMLPASPSMAGYVGTAARRALLRRIGCTTPVPIG